MNDCCLDKKEFRILAESFQEGQDLLFALFHYLKLRNWQGVSEQLVESLPHFSQEFTVKDLNATLNDIGFSLNTIRLNNKTLDVRLLPVIYIDNDKHVSVICEEEGQYIKINETGERTIIDWPQKYHGTICLINEKKESQTNKTWFRQVFLHSKMEFGILAILSCATNLFLLMTPLYIMFVYDKVIKAHSMLMLWSFLSGMMIILGSYWFLQKMRRQVVADLCAYSVKSVDNSILSKIIKLPSSYTEVSSISSQITRVQDYEAINETFARNILSLLIDVPFYLLFLIVFYFIGGTLVLVPLTGIALYGLLLLGHSLWDKYIASNELQVDTSWRSFLIESVKKIYAIRGAHFEKPWMKRFAYQTAIMVQDKYKEAYRQSVYEVLGDAALLVIVFGLLGAGVLFITEDNLSVGGLIAGMILIWQIMNPVKLLVNRFKQFSNFRKTLTQIDRIGNIEQEEYANIGDKPKLEGKIEFNQVGIRYAVEREPALMGVTFTAEPGELIIITGPNGSGKSTILKLLLRLYQQQVGSITIDGQDIRQIPHNLLRKCIAYAPKKPQFFYGTILQNLKLVNPLATMDEVVDACEKASVLRDIKQLPNGFDTRIRDNELEQLPASFKQRLQLARTLLMDAPIMLLDEPASHLDGEHDKNFIELIKSLKGKQTIIMNSHRPSHLELGDKVIYIEKGQIKHIETPHDGVKKIERVGNV